MRAFSNALLLFFALIFNLGSAWAFVPGKIALIQYNADRRFGQYEENMKNLTALALEAVASGAKVIVFPEGSIIGYAAHDGSKFVCAENRVDSNTFKNKCLDVVQVSEEIPAGTTSNYWQEFAQQKQVHVLFNLPESKNRHYFNTTGVVGPNGFVGKYRKRDLYKTDELYADPGNQELLFETDIGRFGVLICMDIWSKNYFTSYRSQGASAILFPTAWDQAPPGANQDFGRQAKLNRIDIFASDVSPWDGTGFYSKNGGPRLRPNLPEPGVNIEGYTIIEVSY